MKAPRQHYLAAVDCFEDVVIRIRDDQWELPSACPPWTARQLAGHVIDGQHQVLGMLRGTGLVTPKRDPADLERVAGTAPAATWHRARAQTLAALTDVDDASVVSTPLGDTPVSRLLATAVIEPLLHAWDLAAAVGGTADLDPETVQVTLAAVRSMGDQLAATGMYAPARSLHDGMTALERLLALTGRN